MEFKQQKLLFSVIIRCALLKIIKTSNYMFVCYIVTLLRFWGAQHSPYTHLNKMGNTLYNSLSKACANILQLQSMQNNQFLYKLQYKTEANWQQRFYVKMAATS